MTTAGATSLGYDGRGNLTSSGGASYGYTAENRMFSAPGVTMAYEPAGGQLLQLYTTAGVDTRFAWSGSQMIAEMNPSTISRRYVPGPGVDEPVVWYEGSGTSDRRWLHADERGSVVAVSDGSGNAIAVNRYDEYGIPASGNIGRFQYTGQAWLPELGMYYYKARIYSPTLGRFMQTDPIGYGAGMNAYNYVSSDPVNLSDPSGLLECRTIYVPSPSYMEGYDPGWIRQTQCDNFGSPYGGNAPPYGVGGLTPPYYGGGGVDGSGQPNIPLPEDAPGCTFGYAPLSKADQALFSSIYNDPDVSKSMLESLKRTTLSGNEWGFLVYPDGGGFRPGGQHQGTPGEMPLSYRAEYIVNMNTNPPIAGFHVHPNGVLSPSYPDVTFSKTTNTLGIIGTRDGIIAGRKCR